jgi:hypothetical protein
VQVGCQQQQQQLALGRPAVPAAACSTADACRILTRQLLIQ